MGWSNVSAVKRKLAGEAATEARSERTHYALVRLLFLEIDADSKAGHNSDPSSDIHWSDWALATPEEREKNATTAPLKSEPLRGPNLL